MKSNVEIQKNQRSLQSWKCSKKNTKTIFLTTIAILISSIVGISKLSGRK